MMKVLLNRFDGSSTAPSAPIASRIAIRRQPRTQKKPKYSGRKVNSASAVSTQSVRGNSGISSGSHGNKMYTSENHGIAPGSSTGGSSARSMRRHNARIDSFMDDALRAQLLLDEGRKWSWMSKRNQKARAWD